MPTLKVAADDFLAQKRIAVAGVSRTPAGHGANVVYTGLRKAGYQVFAVNPHADQVEGDRCYSYAGNNPINFNDRSGLCFGLGNCGPIDDAW